MCSGLPLLVNPNIKQLGENLSSGFVLGDVAFNHSDQSVTRKSDPYVPQGQHGFAQVISPSAHGRNKTNLVTVLEHMIQRRVLQVHREPYG